MPVSPGEKLTKSYNAIVSDLQSMAEDVEKAAGGNGAAGTRIRKVIQKARGDLANLKKISLGKPV
jgi:hypothetical protein